jgi:hypothetical protein
MRALAEEMYDVKSRSIMLRSASDYDKLASRAEERAKTSGPGPSPIRELINQQNASGHGVAQSIEITRVWPRAGV